jgi:hypothetical protein
MQTKSRLFVEFCVASVMEVRVFAYSGVGRRRQAAFA